MSWFKRIFGHDNRGTGARSSEPSLSGYDVSLSEVDQLEIASLFLNATRPSLHARSGIDEGWRQKIGASIPQVVPSLCNAGFLREADTTEMLEAEFSLKKLKEVAKGLGLKVSGKKADLAQRITDAGFTLKNAEAEEALLICTCRMRVLVEEYRATKKLARENARKKTLELLRCGEIAQACELVAQFESEQYWPRGMNIDWSTEAPKLVRDTKRLMRANPNFLIRRFGRVPNEARLLAVMSNLWGVNEFPALRAELVSENMGEDDLCLCSDALRSYHPQGNGRSEIEALGIAFHWECVAKEASDTCGVCKSANGQRYKPDNEPELPHAECECQRGCRCLYIHSFDGFGGLD